jgi:putative Mg2+ transporter-C (MgtC) family protein
MSPTLHWPELMIRVAAAIVAGAIIGANRVEYGKPAGLRTTILVCLAATFAMLLTNLLLDTNGRPPDSFVQFDVMRLPLGVLSGMGFIGAGTILRRSDLVVGVTTAASLWLVTIIGLCIGAGEIGLGAAATALGFATLWGLGLAERRIPQQKQARLTVAYDDGPVEYQLLSALRAHGFAIVSLASDGKFREARFDLRWRGLPAETEPPPFLSGFASQNGIHALHWSCLGDR